MINLKNKKIWVCGHRGLVGSAIFRQLQGENCDILTVPRQQLDLTNQASVNNWFEDQKPDYVILAAAKVGGIHANATYPADFIRDNLQIQTNVIDGAYRNGIEKLVFLGSSCIYPKFAPQPMAEDCLLTGPLEPTNQAYAVAKIAGITMCQSYHQQYGFNAISLMPTNVYGPGDNFNPMTSHVIPGLLYRFHEAKQKSASEILIWGDGTPLREFIHVDDLADACLHLLKNYNSSEIINVGTGQEVSIRELAQIIQRITGFEGVVKFDSEKPNGTPRKLLNISKLKNLGWNPKIPLEDGIRDTYNWFVQTAKESVRAIRV